MRARLLCLLLCACAAPPDTRRAWLVEQLLQDNAVWLTRDTELLATKYRAMAADPYDWMRGTAGVFLRDQSRPGTERVSTAFLREPAAGHVLLAGDPHPENFGAFLPGRPLAAPEELRIDLNDLDGAAFGPWLWDLRRGALGVAMLLDGVDGCDGACTEGAVGAFARGYATQIAALAAGEPGVDPRDPTGHGAVVADFLADVARDGARRRRLSGDTETNDDGTLRLEREPLDAEGDGKLDVSDADRARVDVLTDAWLARNPGRRVLDVTRRFGQGVASLPAWRFYLLVDDGMEDSADDLILSVREVVDPPVVPGLSLPVDGLLSSAMERVPEASRRLWSRPDNDPELLGLRDGVMAFKVQSRDSWYEGFDHLDLADAIADGTPDDLTGLTGFLGAVLASAHARAATADCGSALDALAADLAGDGELLAVETIEATAGAHARTLADLELFRVALDELGPLLGADQVYEELP